MKGCYFNGSFTKSEFTVSMFYCNIFSSKSHFNHTDCLSCWETKFIFDWLWPWWIYHDNSKISSADFYCLEILVWRMKVWILWLLKLISLVFCGRKKPLCHGNEREHIGLYPEVLNLSPEAWNLSCYWYDQRLGNCWRTKLFFLSLVELSVCCIWFWNMLI